MTNRTMYDLFQSDADDLSEAYLTHRRIRKRARAICQRDNGEYDCLCMHVNVVMKKELVTWLRYFLNSRGKDWIHLPFGGLYLDAI